MDHGYFTDRVSAYLDNELPPQERQVVEEHLRGCAECRALLEKLTRLDSMVNQQADLAGSDYWEDAAQKIEQRLGFAQPTVITPIKRRWYERGLAWKAVAAAASLVLIGYIGFNADKILKKEKLQPPAQAPSVNMPSTMPADTLHATPGLQSDVKQKAAPASPAPKDVASERKVETGRTTEKEVADQKAGEATPTPTVREESADRDELTTVKTVAVEEESKPAVAEKTPVEVSRAKPQPAQSMDVRILAPDTHNYRAAAPAAAAPKQEERQKQVINPQRIVEAYNAAHKGETPEAQKAADSELQAKLEPVADSADSLLAQWRTKITAISAYKAVAGGQSAFGTSSGGSEHFAAKSARGVQPSASAKSTADSTYRPNPQQVEKEWIEAWFHIARLTKDQEEREKGIAEIKRVAHDFRSDNWKQAAKYLVELGVK